MFCQHYARELWENADCRDKFLADARAALSAAEQAREPVGDGRSFQTRVAEWGEAAEHHSDPHVSDEWRTVESAPSAKAVLIAYKNRSDKWRIIKAVRYEQFQSEQDFDE